MIINIHCGKSTSQPGKAALEAPNVLGETFPMFLIVNNCVVIVKISIQVSLDAFRRPYKGLSAVRPYKDDPTKGFPAV